MKRLFVGLAFIALVALGGFNLLAPGTARAQTSADCAAKPTIASLEVCVKHAAAQGFITSQGVTRSLLARLDTADEALEHGRTSQAINVLEAFINEVQAQAGKHIDPMHAQHLVAHAQMVIQVLNQR